MPQPARETCQSRKDDWFEDDLRQLVGGVACRCAEAPAHADAPLARALFHRVEVMRQPREMAARTLGIKAGDAAYLLRGLRQDVAGEFIIQLEAERMRDNEAEDKETGDE